MAGHSLADILDTDFMEAHEPGDILDCSVTLKLSEFIEGLKSLSVPVRVRCFHG